MPKSYMDSVHTPLDMEKIRPYQDHILIRQYQNDKTSGGVYFPKDEKTACYFGKVIAVGSGIPNPKKGTVHPHLVKPGDFVIVMKYAGEDYVSPGENFKLVREEGIWAVIKGRLEDGVVEIKDLEPYGDRILARPRKCEKFFGTSIYVPNADPQTFMNHFEILKVGAGPIHWKVDKRIPQDVHPGQVVLARRYSGCDLEVAGEPLRIIEGADIFTVWEGELE